MNTRKTAFLNASVGYFPNNSNPELTSRVVLNSKSVIVMIELSTC